MEFRKQDLLHEIDVVWLSSLESSKLYASCMQCNAIFKSVIVLYFFLITLGYLMISDGAERRLLAMLATPHLLMSWLSQFYFLTGVEVWLCLYPSSCLIIAIHVGGEQFCYKSCAEIYRS